MPARHPALTEQRLGLAAVLAGAALAFGVQVLAPVGVPLYDGVAVQEPYRYLHPTGDQPGSPTSYSATVDIAGGASPQITAATTEVPAQAQLVALPGALILADGTTTLQVSVAPIQPPAVPAGGQIAGNVYRFRITDESGAAVAIKPCDGCISLVMRSPEDIGPARLQRFAGGAWSDVDTVHAGIVGMYATNPTVLGDYAVVTGGSGANAGDGDGDAGGESGLATALIVAGGSAVIVVLAVVAVLVLRGRSAPRAPDAPRAVPSKRKDRPGPRSGGTRR